LGKISDKRYGKYPATPFSSNSVKINEVDQWIVPDLEIMEVISP